MNAGNWRVEDRPTNQKVGWQSEQQNKAHRKDAGWSRRHRAAVLKSKIEYNSTLTKEMSSNFINCVDFMRTL